jgi:uncharacterized damage-inducible protein DinB
MNRKLIDEYEFGGGKLRKAIGGLSEKDLRWTPAPDAGVGLWSIQQIVIHLMDSDLIWAARMKSIIAEDNPMIVGYDESKFASHLFYAEQDAENALRIFDLNRRQFARILRSLSDSAYARTGRHSERGVITLEQSLQWMVEHVDHHVEFIRQKRQKLNKPLRD